MADRRQELLTEKQSLATRMEQIDRELYDMEPNTFTITDERTGRTFTLNKNSYENRINFPKVNPDTGRRLYGEGEYWIKKDGKYIVERAVYNEFDTDLESLIKFDDKEYVFDEMYNSDYIIYHEHMGWAKVGYYWKDTYNNYGEYVSTIERKIPVRKNKN
jgi:hypothetical protein